jgi:hypothetical protein
VARIGVTGHSNLTADSTPLVENGIRAALTGRTRASGLVGVTCLARGADQIFARVVLDLGGVIHVVLPAADYRERKVKPENAAEFDELISRAARIHTMSYERSAAAAYLAAGEHVLACVDEMIAVWDGLPSAGQGGTADVVEAARRRGLPVTVVWPDGATRT